MTLTDYVYTAVAGDTFDLIAMKVWKDEKYAAELLMANPAHSCVSVFSGGEVLNLPEIDVELDDDDAEPMAAAAPWKEG